MSGGGGGVTMQCGERRLKVFLEREKDNQVYLVGSATVQSIILFRLQGFTGVYW